MAFETSDILTFTEPGENLTWSYGHHCLVLFGGEGTPPPSRSLILKCDSLGTYDYINSFESQLFRNILFL